MDMQTDCTFLMISHRIVILFREFYVTPSWRLGQPEFRPDPTSKTTPQKRIVAEFTGGSSVKIQNRVSSSPWRLQNAEFWTATRRILQIRCEVAPSSQCDHLRE